MSAVWERLPEFRGFMQHDAQEFLCTYLDKLDAELLDRRVYYNVSPEKSLSSLPLSSPTKGGFITQTGDIEDTSRRTVVSIFRGTTLSTLSCRKCGHRSASRQPSSFVTLGGLAQWEKDGDSTPPKPNGQPADALPTPQRRSLRKSQAETQAAPPEMPPPDAPTADMEDSVPLSELLRQFTSPEHQDYSMIACEKCGSKDAIYRQVNLERLPEILVIHINRIRWDGAARHKLQWHVDFPLKGLDMTPFTEPSSSLRGQRAVYDLYSVINHHGRHFGNGHYTTYCYSEEANHWTMYVWRYAGSCTDTRFVGSATGGWPRPQRTRSRRARPTFCFTFGGDPPLFIITFYNVPLSFLLLS